MTTATDITTRIRHDLFTAIRYEKRGKKGAVTGVELDGHFVLKWIFEDAWNYISAGIRTADKYKFHSAKDLFNNPEVWDGYGEKKTGIHIAIGRCLAYFVRQKMLPLSCFNPHESNKLYLLTGQ